MNGHCSPKARRCVLAAAVIVLAIPALAAAQGSPPPSEVEEWTPVVFDGTELLAFEPDPALELAEGTIELWAAAMWDEDPGYAPCIVANRTVPVSTEDEDLAAATRFSVHVSGDRQAVEFWNGSGWGRFPADLTDGELHHIALVTEDGATTLYVDGESAGGSEAGYGTGTGLPLHLGSSDGYEERFFGALWSLRIWSRPLDADAVGTLAAGLRPPPTEFAALDALAASLDLLGDRPELEIVEGAGATEEASPALPQLPDRN
ncbi:MAG: LamG domain-containing protein [Myxococcota bacterium]